MVSVRRLHSGLAIYVCSGFMIKLLHELLGILVLTKCQIVFVLLILILNQIQKNKNLFQGLQAFLYSYTTLKFSQTSNTWRILLKTNRAYYCCVTYVSYFGNHHFYSIALAIHIYWFLTYK